MKKTLYLAERHIGRNYEDYRFKIIKVGNLRTKKRMYRTFGDFYQLQRTCDKRYVIEETKNDAGKRKISITENVAMMFLATN